jgi:hypothetical protein
MNESWHLARYNIAPSFFGAIGCPWWRMMYSICIAASAFRMVSCTVAPRIASGAVSLLV